ncbi:hypothetical protein RIF29_30701 [Crotalaria pallida]|uniref:Bulb-type lectin domain-containing protein n=1 Tax=Crotalaria pallida TaxID=3830 RepID=A0AAN9EGG1_CROPI
MFWFKPKKPYLLLIFTYLLCLWTIFCCIHVIKAAAIESLKPGDSLNSTNALCSESYIYCLLFSVFEDGRTYLVVRDNDGTTTDSYGTFNYLWIANRNQPIINSDDNGSGILLSFDHSGVLKIEESQQQGEKPIILYSPPTPHSAANNSNTTVAAVLDTGNFVVQQLNPDGSTKNVLWQSFDYSTDTWIPGMKLGVNYKTGHNWSLVSWASEKCPLLGPFRLEWEPREGELIISRRYGEVVWKSGKLRNNGFFENIPKESQLMYNYTLVSTKDENYFSFTTPYTEQTTNWKLFESGHLTGLDGKDIARADMCYGYNTDGGCQKWKIPSCRYPGYVFEIFQGMGLPGYGENNDTNYDYFPIYGIGDCQDRCWSNCSCLGFMSSNDDGTGCVFFYGKSLANVSLVTVGGKKFYMLVKKQQHRGVNRWIWISALIATSLIICTSILCLAIKKRKHVLEVKRRMKIEMQDLPVFDGSTGTKDLKAWELWNDSACLQLIDPSLNDAFVPDEVYRCIHIALLCVEHYAKDRPNMSDIISLLTNKSIIITTLPRRPAFYVGRDIIEGKRSSKCTTTSNSDFVKENSSYTEVEPR